MYILIANSFNSFKLLWLIAYDIVLSSVTILIWKQHFLVQILSFFLSFAGIFNLKVNFIVNVGFYFPICFSVSVLIIIYYILELPYGIIFLYF